MTAKETHYILRVADKDPQQQFLKVPANKGTNSSEGTSNSHGTNGDENDEDDLLREDISTWDVFDDYHKFQLREMKLKEKRKKEAQRQRQQIEM